MEFVYFPTNFGRHIGDYSFTQHYPTETTITPNFFPSVPSDTTELYYISGDRALGCRVSPKTSELNITGRLLPTGNLKPKYAKSFQSSHERKTRPKQSVF